MRFLPCICLVSTLVLGPTSLAAEQHQHGSADQRAHAAMGFDQERTSHHFLLFTDGGAIDVTVADGSDSKNRDAIRSHLAHIAALFGNGDFAAPMLVHDTQDVPGTATMAAKKAAIRYRYAETPNGGRVDIHTSDRAAVEAVHVFLKYQIAEHKTGDSLTPRAR